MFRTDRKPNRIGLNPLIFQLFLCQLAVGRSCRMNDQTFHIGYIGKQREYLKTVNKCMRLFDTALDLKGENGRPSVRKIF